MQELCAVTGTALGAAGGSSNEKGNTVDVTVSHSVSITRTSEYSSPQSKSIIVLDSITRTSEYSSPQSKSS